MQVTLRDNPNNDGSPNIIYTVDPEGSDLNPILTGPHARGEIVLINGTHYNLSAGVIEAPMRDHREILHYCNLAAQSAGVTVAVRDASGIVSEVPYVHDCDVEGCFPEATVS